MAHILIWRASQQETGQQRTLAASTPPQLPAGVVSYEDLVLRAQLQELRGGRTALGWDGAPSVLTTSEGLVAMLWPEDQRTPDDETHTPLSQPQYPGAQAHLAYRAVYPEAYEQGRKR
jgi:hypothetical protein